jgi:hypothetical protein
MVVFEYRVVMPFTLDEFDRGFRYLCARQSQEVMASSANGETVFRQAQGRFTTVPEIVELQGRVPARRTLCNDGSYICNQIHLGTRFPRWVRRLVPDAALRLREEYWAAYPYSFTRYSSEYWPKRIEFTIESLHVAKDVGESEGIFGDMTSKEQQQCITQVLDIAGAPDESTPGVFQGDPTSFHSTRSGRGPLSGPGWWKPSSSTTSETESTPPSLPCSGQSKAYSMPEKALVSECELPLMCVYKRARCKIHIIPFASRMERVVLESTVRDMAVLGFRNLFCWTDFWFHLSHSELTRFEEVPTLA